MFASTRPWNTTSTLLWCQRGTGVLQPNDVHVFGPLKALAGGVWRKQMREEPKSYDSLEVTIERHLNCWDRLTRETDIHAWKDADPLLSGLRNWPGTASV